MRLNRSTIILFIVSLVIIIGVVIFQDPIENLITPPPPTSTIQGLLPEDLADQATRLIVREGENFTQVDKESDTWKVSDGTVIDASRDTHTEFVDGLLDLMSGFEYMTQFISDDISQFGLDNPRGLIEIHTPDRNYRLNIGDTNPDGDRIYVQLNDAPDIYLMPTVFEFGNILRLATEPPYYPLLAETTEEPSDSLLFPDVFGYQITEFRIDDRRDGSYIRYIQGDSGTWSVEGTVVDESRDINHGEAAINISLFLFLDVDLINQQVRDTATSRSILTLSMQIEDDGSYTMDILVADEVGYIGILNDTNQTKAFILETSTVNSFFDMVRQPPYANVTD